MSDESTTGGDQQARRSVNLQMEDSELNYANTAIVTGTPEEVILNFGINTMPPAREGRTTVQVTDRVILSYPSAKRLAVTLGNIIRRYEDAHGVIEIQRQTPPPTREQAAPGEAGE